MNSDSVPETISDPASHQAHHGADATALQHAIRQRSIDTLTADQTRPATPASQRLLIIGLTLGAMLVFVLVINFVVGGIQRIMDVWYPGSISGEVESPITVQPLRPGQPYYITVDPPVEAPQSGVGAASSSVATGGDGKR